jgi:transcriptional regulator with XRE-family HTH domain
MNLSFQYKGSALKIARESRGITLNEASKVLGASAIRLLRIESGYYDIGPDILKKASQVFDYPIEFFEQEFKQDKKLRATLLRKLKKHKPKPVYSQDDLFAFFNFMSAEGIEYRTFEGKKYYRKDGKRIGERTILDQFNQIIS